MKSFQGIFPALLTPFNADGTIAHDTLRELVRMNLKKGVAGFYVCGSTAEAFLLSLDERKAILETVTDEVAGRATVISHVGCISLDQAIELARHAKACHADAMSSIPPFYYNFSWEEIRDYYFALVDAVDLPMFIYNFPGFSGVKLTVDNVLTFLKDKRFIGVKHTSSDYYMLERFKHARDGVIVYNGFDEMFLSGIAMGADGGVGSTYNFMAEKFIQIIKDVKEGNMDDARRLQNQANNILQLLMRVGIMPGEKAALQMMGFEMGDCRRPFRTLSDAERAELKRTLIENGCEVK
jgi:N-acetylneuraminate lyase